MAGNDPPPAKIKMGLESGDPVEVRFTRAVRVVLDVEAGETYRAAAEAELEAAMPGVSITVDLAT